MTRITATLPGVFMDTELFADGWQLQSVEGWWGATDPRLDNEAREWGHGDFGQAEAFQDARFVTLSGVFQCRADPDAILAADGVLTALLNREEFPLSIAYGSRSGTVMARMASRVSWDPDHAPGAAQFEVTFKADDPRIYGVTQTASTGVPTAGVGVADPLLDPFQVGTLTEVGRNLFTNPNLVGDGTFAEVRRNLVVNPFAGGSTAFIGASRMTASDGGTFVRGTITDALPNAYSQRFTSHPAPVIAGLPYSVRSKGRTTASAGKMVLAIQFLAADNSQVGPLVEGAITTVGAVDFTDLGPIQNAIAPVGATKVATWIGLASGARNVGDFVDAQHALLEQSPTVGVYFDGSTVGAQVQPEDFRTRWLGTPNASESVLEIEQVRGLTATNCVAGVSTKGGKPAVRQIPLNSSTSTYSLLGIPVSAQGGGTSVGTLHLDAPITGPLSASALRLRAQAPIQESVAPNVAGTHPLRTVYGALSSQNLVVLLHGGSVGSGDVWWTDIGLFAGNYDGPAVSGDSPASGDLVYVWAGQRNNSETIIYQVDASAEGNLGRVSVVNGGNAPTEPTVTVTGGLSGGFELLCIETGRVVRVTRPIPDGSQISIAMGSGEIWIDGQSPVPAQFAPVTEWIQVQPGQTCTIQFTPLGVVSGTPTMTAKWAGADW